MSKRTKSISVDRIIDANINRTKEGLRVCEEITRFILNSRVLTSELKSLRHEIYSASKLLGGKERLIDKRFSLSDVGKDICGNELKRINLADIFFANIQRVKEGLRALEEFSKLIDIKAALRFKQARYKIYALEKKIAKRIKALSVV